MALSYKARRGWSLIALLIGLPIYIVLAVNIIDWVGEMHFVVELIVYVFLGVAWVFPLKPILLGVGKADPDELGD